MSSNTICWIIHCRRLVVTSSHTSLSIMQSHATIKRYSSTATTYHYMYLRTTLSLALGTVPARSFWLGPDASTRKVTPLKAALTRNTLFVLVYLLRARSTVEERVMLHSVHHSTNNRPSLRAEILSYNAYEDILISGS